MNKYLSSVLSAIMVTSEWPERLAGGNKFLRVVSEEKFKLSRKGS